MEIIINGKNWETEDTALNHILEQHPINLNNCIVELNGKFVDRENYDHTQVAEGDRLELIQFIGGG